jgi:hypothetical protein
MLTGVCKGLDSVRGMGGQSRESQKFLILPKGPSGLLLRFDSRGILGWSDFENKNRSVFFMGLESVIPKYKNRFILFSALF